MNKVLWEHREGSSKGKEEQVLLTLSIHGARSLRIGEPLLDLGGSGGGDTLVSKVLEKDTLNGP